MKTINQYFISTLVALIVLFGSCQKDNYDLGELIAPTDVTLTYQIVGADEQNPAGDGSGLVNFTATANHAITYNFDFGDGKDNEITPAGKITHMFSKTGIHLYNVTVYAIGTGGISSNTTIQIEVNSTFADDEAELFLSGGSTKKWYWAADQPGHLGLGPNDQAYANGEHTYAAWYVATPWEKSATSLYECEFVFSIESGQLTFEHINPTGEAFIQGIYAGELGLGAEGSYPFDIGGVKNVSFSPSASIATIDGGYRGTTMSFSGGGFMGFYAGSSTYEIMEVTENLLKVRNVQANQPLFAWYHVFTNVKPTQK